MNEYFTIGNCPLRDCCENNGFACNNCIRNDTYRSDNFKMKSYTNNIYNNDVCSNCSCNPKNGGSGICNRTLNNPIIT